MKQFCLGIESFKHHNINILAAGNPRNISPRPHTINHLESHLWTQITKCQNAPDKEGNLFLCFIDVLFIIRNQINSSQIGNFNGNSSWLGPICALNAV